MVVTARDSQLLDTGFADDASEAMPGLDDAVMPMDGDDAALPEDGSEDGEATPETQPFSVESLALSPDQLTALERHYESLVAPKVRESLEAEWNPVRQSLEAKVNAFDRDRQQAANLVAAHRKVFLKFLADNGVDEQAMKALEFDVRQEAGQMAQYQRGKQAQAQQVQQAQTAEQAEFQTWQSEITGAMQQHVAGLGLKPDDPRITQRFNRVLQAAQVWTKTPTQENLELYQSLKDDHKAWVQELADASKKRAAAKPSSDALNRQRGRGPQNLGRGSGSGTAPMSFTEHIEAVQRQHPELDYSAAHEMANAQFRASRRA